MVVCQRWLEVLDLPDVEQSCRLVVPAPRPCSVLALRDALGSGDPDGVADHLPAALDAVDHPASRASIARAVLELEASGGLRPAVAEAAVGDLSAGKPSVLLMAALLAGLSAEVGVRPTRLAGLAQALGPSRPRSAAPGDEVPAEVGSEGHAVDVFDVTSGRSTDQRISRAR
jgi:hypothetical protein